MTSPAEVFRVALNDASALVDKNRELHGAIQDNASIQSESLKAQYKAAEKINTSIDARLKREGDNLKNGENILKLLVQQSETQETVNAALKAGTAIQGDFVKAILQQTELQREKFEDDKAYREAQANERKEAQKERDREKAQNESQRKVSKREADDLKTKLKARNLINTAIEKTLSLTGKVVKLGVYSVGMGAGLGYGFGRMAESQADVREKTQQLGFTEWQNSLAMRE